MEILKAIILREDKKGNVGIQLVQTDQDYIDLANSCMHRRHPELARRSYRRKSYRDYDADSHLEDLGYVTDITCAADLEAPKEAALSANKVATWFSQMPEFYVPATLNGVVMDSLPPLKEDLEKYPGMVNYHGEVGVLKAVIEQEPEARAYYTFTNDQGYWETLTKVVSEYSGKNHANVSAAVRKLSSENPGGREI